MSDAMLLVDPLAALLRPALAGIAPLRFEKTHVDISIVPPMANIAIERCFTNTTDQLVEAVMTLPPLAPHEVVYRLLISIGRRHHVEAVPQPARRARRAHDAAIHEGRVAILYDLLEHDVQLIAIGGVEPGETVQVQIWSTRPLARPDKDRAALTVNLAAGPDFPRRGLSEADAPVISGEYESGTLVVHASETIRATFRPWNDLPEIFPNHAERVFDCGVPIVLDFIALEGDNLDHSEWQVGQPGGWEVTAERNLETFRHALNPGGGVTSDRTDWIHGVAKTDDGEIRVTAPLPTDEIAPNARAFRAFAAANLVSSATPQDAAIVRRTANILSRQTSLVFIGPQGETADDLPMLPLMRKLALPEMRPFENLD
uniref:VIT domain-containing protein n=1 Tax=Dongia sp. TaxID=1977262 RepID=UPI0035AECDCD